MNSWIENSLNSNSPTILIAAFILGLFGAFSSCCNYAIIASIISFSSDVLVKSSKRAKTFFILTYTIGSVVSIALTGALMGFIGSSVVSLIGDYWKIAAGVVLIVFGLISLRLININTTANVRSYNSGVFTGLLLGIVTGAISIASSTCCSPALPIILSVSFVNASVIWGFIIMIFFGLGFTLPFTLGIYGLKMGLGKFADISKYISFVAGILMILIGFYFIYTF